MQRTPIYIPRLSNPHSFPEYIQDGDGETDQDDDVDAGNPSAEASGPGPPPPAPKPGGGGNGWNEDGYQQQNGGSNNGSSCLGGGGGGSGAKVQQGRGGASKGAVLSEPKVRLDKVKPEAKEVGVVALEMLYGVCTVVA